MTDPDTSRGSLGGYAGRLRHPYLAATTGLGVVLVLVGWLLATTDPTLGFRVGFLGALVTLFGATGSVAFWVNDQGSARERGQ